MSTRKDNLLAKIERQCAKVEAGLDLPEIEKRRVGVEAVKAFDGITREALSIERSRLGASEQNEVAEAAHAAKVWVGAKVFGLDPAALTSPVVNTATVTGVRNSDITKNLADALRREIDGIITGGDPEEALTTFENFLKAIGYTEHTESGES